jgi:DNA-binding response OmpR family regulator
LIEKTGISILLVDDQPDILANLSMALQASGYHVFSAGDGYEALAILQTRPVNLILADIAMPRMNGYQLYEQVRSTPPWFMIPFLFLTARALDSDIRYGKGLGVDDYLTKPIEVEDLLAAVQGKLRRTQQLVSGNLVAASATSPVPPSKDPILIVGRLKINIEQYQGWLDDRLIVFSAREFALLVHLAQHIEQVILAQELVLITHQLSTDHIEAGTLLRPLIGSLRRKLNYNVGERSCIENVRSVGYRLLMPD